MIDIVTVNKQSDYKKVEVAIVANRNPKEIKKLTNLKWIQSIWVGVENLVESFKGESMKIVRLIDPEMNRTMAEAVLSWVLYLHRDMYFYRVQQNKSTWKELDYIKRDIEQRIKDELNYTFKIFNCITE